MLWNDQLLTFAGVNTFLFIYENSRLNIRFQYEQEDGTVLGDPKNIGFTKELIELGWTPPQQKTRFDLLPVVVMAEGDLPVIIELPAPLRKLVEIRHPRYEEAFEKLDLKWGAFPALSRLGYDIGGVQYTATPFIGWLVNIPYAPSLESHNLARSQVHGCRNRCSQSC